ncbi:MAG: putative serine protease HtrA [Pseudomonadota bacterium]
MRHLEQAIVITFALSSLQGNAQSLEAGINATALISSNRALGSGFLIDEQHVVTNSHVIGKSKCSEIHIAWKDGKVNECDAIVARDKRLDLAVIRLRLREVRDPLPISDFVNADVGNEIYIIGNPRGSLFLTSKGIISSRDYSQVDFYPSKISWIFNFDGALNPGNSGGPILDRESNVLGVAMGSVRGTTGVNVGIRSDMLIAFLRHFDIPHAIVAKQSPNETQTETQGSQPVKTVALIESNEPQSQARSFSPNQEKMQNPEPTSHSASIMSEIHNPFSFAGLKLSLGGLIGVDYGDYTSFDAGQKESGLDKLSTKGVTAFIGADIGLTDGKWLSTVGVWNTAFHGSSLAATNTYYEQFSDRHLEANDYKIIFSDDINTNAGAISAMETEIGIYVLKFMRLSTGQAHARVDLYSNNGTDRYTAELPYRVNTIGFLFSGENWGFSVDFSKLYGTLYQRTAIRAVCGLNYALTIFD